MVRIVTLRKIRAWTTGMALSASSSPLYADQLSFDTLYRSPHYLGRGDTGVAIADDQEAIFYNPAGLATGKGIYKKIVLLSPSLEASTQTKDLVRQVLVEEENNPDTLRNYLGKNIHLGVRSMSAIVLRRAAIGALISTETNVLIAKSAEARGIEGVTADAAVNKVLTFSLAESFWGQNLQIGSTFKFIMRNEAKLQVSALDAGNIANQLGGDSAQQERRGLGVDLGLMYRLNQSPWRLGLHMENAGSTYLRATEKDANPRRLPQIVTLGGAYEMTTKLDSFRLLFDMRDVGGVVEQSTAKRLHLGTELTIARILGLSAGLNQGYPTAGIFMNLYLLRLDMGTYTQEIGQAAGVRPDQRYFFRLMAGF